MPALSDLVRNARASIPNQPALATPSSSHAGEGGEDVAAIKQPLPILRWQLSFSACLTSQRNLDTPFLPLPSPSNPIRPQFAIGRFLGYYYAKLTLDLCQHSAYT